jgi:hypothetical protein
MASAPLLLEALGTMPGDGQARLDLSVLVFSDSSGLHAIVQFARQEDGNAPVILEGASAILMTIRGRQHLGTISMSRFDRPAPMAAESAAQSSGDSRHPVIHRHTE